MFEIIRRNRDEKRQNDAAEDFLRKREQRCADEREESARRGLHERILHRDTCAARAASPTESEPRKYGDHVIPREPCATTHTTAASAYRAYAVAKDNDVEKAPDHKTKYSERRSEHDMKYNAQGPANTGPCFLSTANCYCQLLITASRRRSAQPCRRNRRWMSQYRHWSSMCHRYTGCLQRQRSQYRHSRRCGRPFPT